LSFFLSHINPSLLTQRQGLGWGERTEREAQKKKKREKEEDKKAEGKDRKEVKRVRRLKKKAATAKKRETITIQSRGKRERGIQVLPHKLRR
jgi:hypothetical protein